MEPQRSHQSHQSPERTTLISRPSSSLREERHANDSTPESEELTAGEGALVVPSISRKPSVSFEPDGTAEGARPSNEPHSEEHLPFVTEEEPAPSKSAETLLRSPFPMLNRGQLPKIVKSALLFAKVCVISLDHPFYTRLIAIYPR